MDDIELPESVGVLRRILFEGFSLGNTGIVDELCSPDLIEHQFGLDGQGAAALERVREAIRQVHEAMPDLTYDLEDWATRGDTGWVRFYGRGTNTGPFFGPPSGKHVELTVIDVATVVDGKITEHWGVPDRFSLLQQTGVLRRLRPAEAPGVGTGGQTDSKP
ncbi:ester cyclase [Arthrobacter sp. zg-Y916]|uniref:Ester cyclase n=1 Tax=Arthrobacter caoxuetaonis TaxID=2886935 RepID=A0A9X1MBE1_9MICC|nr:MULTISPECIES: ester cyclase [Arthrobacter]MCC3296431.1 ester cyclase [Arthrobacter caoxuetaonis]MCC9192507.1 ester cyclase [Arthrobacter sp. zg-Y916]USQ56733.1 ester cyclase [Arthrobacter caoxuetaonis]